ncbi:hypothetical protein NKH71_32890 [Mesorhizobium sp. M0983]|uniref:hypothetical protein n=1 Tax=Mesorhizobium sp. M0983 TaxID=2957040 RepID=UPI003334E043
MAELAEMVLLGRLISAHHRNLRSVLPSMLITRKRQQIAGFAVMPEYKLSAYLEIV